MADAPQMPDPQTDVAASGIVSIGGVACECGMPAERTTDDGVRLCKKCYDAVPRCNCFGQQVCDVCQCPFGEDVCKPNKSI